MQSPEQPCVKTCWNITCLEKAEEKEDHKGILR